jgi:hypothetical protein
MLWLEYTQFSDITYVRDGYKSAIPLNCKAHIMVVARKLYMKP